VSSWVGEIVGDVVGVKDEFSEDDDVGCWVGEIVGVAVGDSVKQQVVLQN